MKKALIFSVRNDMPVARSSGAHRIAHFLRLHRLDVEVLDFCIHWSLEELQQFVQTRYTDDILFFGFSPFFGHWPDKMNQFTAWLKKTYPQVSTVIGAQSVMIIPATNIDYWIDSYGELAMLALSKHLSGNGDIDCEIILGKKVVRALHKYPAYNMDSYMIKYEKRDYLKPYEFVTTELSRGCKFKCDFCAFPVLGVKEDTSRSADDFYEEMMYNYDNFGLTRYHLADETVNDRVEKIIKCADAVDRLPFKPWYNGFARADLLIKHKANWDDYIRMGFGGHYYGIESFNKASGQLIGKGMDGDKLKNGLLDIKNYWKSHNSPYRGTASMICGLPKESEEFWLSSVDWLLNNWTDQAVVTFYLEVPAPDIRTTKESAFTMNPEKYGIKRHKTFKIADLNFYNLNQGQIYWEHDLMTIDRAKELVINFRETHSSKFMDSAWYNNRYSVIHKTDNMDIILNNSRHTIAWDGSSLEMEFVKEYKENKLNWRPN